MRRGRPCRRVVCLSQPLGSNQEIFLKRPLIAVYRDIELIEAGDYVVYGVLPRHTVAG